MPHRYWSAKVWNGTVFWLGYLVTLPLVGLPLGWLLSLAFHSLGYAMGTLIWLFAWYLFWKNVGEKVSLLMYYRYAGDFNGKG